MIYCHKYKTNNLPTDCRSESARRVYDQNGIAPTQNTCAGGGYETKIAEPICVARGREPQVMAPKRTEYGKRVRKDYEAHKISEQRKNIQRLEPRMDGITNTLTGVQKDNLIAIPSNTADGKIMMELGGVCDLSYPSSKTRRGRVQDNGSVTPTITTHTENALRRIESDYRIRKLTPRECFRLMGVSDADIDKIQAAGISKSQQYKMAVNSIVVNCLAAIFRNLLIGNYNKNQQLELF